MSAAHGEVRHVPVTLRSATFPDGRQVCVTTWDNGLETVMTREDDDPWTTWSPEVPMTVTEVQL